MMHCGIYVHIPFCKSKCKYCAFVSTPDFSIRQRYVSALVGEINDCEANGTVCDTVYIGGGMPSCLPRGALTRIFTALQKKFVILPESEITVECNPESVDGGFVSECKACGVNRVSMGLQSADDRVLAAIGRVHDVSGYIAAAELLRKNFDNISSDIILGLPDQNGDDVFRAIETTSRFCSHISVYALSVEEGTPLAKSGFVADDDGIADMYDAACSALRDRGFDRYEVSNFAKNNMYSRHNIKYWRGVPYIGFGVAAHGYDGKYTRYAHGNDISAYMQNSAPTPYTLTEKDRYNEYVMLALRTERGIDLQDFRNKFGYSFSEANAAIVEQNVKENYVELSNGFLRISPRYMFVMNGITEQFMKD